MLPAERLLLPFSAGPHRMAMALVACSADDLVEIDKRYRDEMAERRTLLSERHQEVFATTPGSEVAQAEALEMVASLLPRRFATWFSQAGPVLHNHLTGEAWDLAHPAHPSLELAGRLVQEDLLLIDPAGPAPLLAAAILCAPSRWLLGEKIGLPLGAVHAQVPLYEDRLSSPVDRFMRSLRPGRAAERMNWSVLDNGALFQPGGKFRSRPNPGVTVQNAPETLFLRVERQVFFRLPRTQMVLFSVRVHSYELARVLAVPGAAADLAAAVRALPPSLAAYKSLPTIAHALLPCLDAHSPSAPAEPSRATAG